MQCKCGGELKPIAITCYQCDICNLKYQVAVITPNFITDAIKGFNTLNGSKIKPIAEQFISNIKKSDLDIETITKSITSLLLHKPKLSFIDKVDGEIQKRYEVMP